MGKPVWGPWTRHDGQAVPVAPGTWCEVKIRAGFVIEDTSHGDLVPNGMLSMWVWSMIPDFLWGYGIVRYRVRQFRAEAEIRALVAVPYAVPASRELVAA